MVVWCVTCRSGYVDMVCYVRIWWYGVLGQDMMIGVDGGMIWCGQS